MEAVTCIDPPYCCENWLVTHRVKTNDIIGVYMRDSGNNDPLYSLDEDAPGHNIHQYVDIDDCNRKGASKHLCWQM